LLIEEPEMFLHPQMQKSLATTLLRLSDTNQVIVTTHSPYFISIPEFKNVRLVSKKGTETTVDCSKLQLPQTKIDKFRKELDPARNELFFARTTVLVEGATERLAIPEYAKAKGIDFDNRGIAVVDVGGKSNLPDYVSICLSFGIETIVLFDRDSESFKEKRDKEKELNAEIEAFASKGCTIIISNPDYEAELRNVIGEKEYQDQCSTYGVTKALRGRLFAIDFPTKIPIAVDKILQRFADTPTARLPEEAT